MKNGEKRSEANVREALESLRTKLFLRFGEKGARRIIIGVPLLTIAFVALIALLLLIPVKQIEVAGEVTMFNEGEIISAASIEEGDSLFLKPSGSIKRSIKKNLPLAERIKVRKGLFGKIRIEVEFADVEFYCKVNDLYYAIDENLRVLDSDESRSKYSAYGAVMVYLPAVREPILGEELVFYDTIEETDTEGETLYKVRDERFYDFASEFLSALKDSGFLPDSNAILLDEKFDVTLIYAKKFEVKFGSMTDLDVKFRILFGILDEGSMQYADAVSVDLTNPSKASARADVTLDLSEYYD